MYDRGMSSELCCPHLRGNNKQLCSSSQGAWESLEVREWGREPTHGSTKLCIVHSSTYRERTCVTAATHAPFAWDSLVAHDSMDGVVDKPLLTNKGCSG